MAICVLHPNIIQGNKSTFIMWLCELSDVAAKQMITKTFEKASSLYFSCFPGGCKIGGGSGNPLLSAVRCYLHLGWCYLHICGATSIWDGATSICDGIPLPEGALKCSYGGRRSGDVKDARLHHSPFAVRRPAIQDPVILTECLHKIYTRHDACFS